MNYMIRLKTTPSLVFIALSLLCFRLLPNAQAVSPPPDGGYPGGNTAEGFDALLSQTTGLYNTAIGAFSNLSLTTANFNTGVGAGTLLANTADQNTATGAGALFSNTTGDSNTANGAFALFNNTIGDSNTATGFEALFSNTEGVGNTANGDSTLSSNTTGGANTANGFHALSSNTTGAANTAIGVNALLNNTTGIGNIAVGPSAGLELTTGNNNIDIGNFGVADDVDTIRIGTGQSRVFIRGIRDVTTGIGDAIPVLIDSAGQLGTMSSSRRFKKEIKPIDKASEAILALKPVTFHYKSDTKGIPQFGLIAEEVAEVNPDLVVHDKKGEIYTVRYDAVNAMLLNEFLKEHRTVQELKSNAARQEATIARQQKQIEAIAEGLEKVSNQLEVSRAGSRTVVNN